MSVYVAGRRGTWHIARHAPSGYGVWALCGKSWNEGHFTSMNIRPVFGEPVCRMCRRIAAPPVPYHGLGPMAQDTSEARDDPGDEQAGA